MHKPRKRELPILLTAHCLETCKIYMFMKFHHHIPYGSEIVAYKQRFAKGKTIQHTVKNQGLSFLFVPHNLDEIYLSGILP